MDKSIYTEQYLLFLKLLRGARKRNNITQIELAARLGETQTFISKCERGERRVDIVELRKWCDAMGVPLADFSAHFDVACSELAKLVAKTDGTTQ